MRMVRIGTRLLNTAFIVSIQELTREGGCMVSLSNGGQVRMQKTVDEAAKLLGLDIWDLQTENVVDTRDAKPTEKKDAGGGGSPNNTASKDFGSDRL